MTPNKPKGPNALANDKARRTTTYKKLREEMLERDIGLVEEAQGDPARVEFCGNKGFAGDCAVLGNKLVGACLGAIVEPLIGDASK